MHAIGEKFPLYRISCLLFPGLPVCNNIIIDYHSSRSQTALFLDRLFSDPDAHPTQQSIW